MFEKSDVRADINPITWLKPFRKNSISHIVKMAIFYHILGLVLASGINGIQLVSDPTYEAPVPPVNLVLIINAGPFEELLFFGLPFYLTGNPYIMLGVGSYWALSHLVGITDDGEFLTSVLGFESFAFAFTTLFFSLRTWMSGKGWLAIIIHSAWNVSIFGVDCSIDQVLSCTIFPNTHEETDFAISGIIGSVILLGITYWAYRRKKRRSKNS